MKCEHAHCLDLEADTIAGRQPIRWCTRCGSLSIRNAVPWTRPALLEGSLGALLDDPRAIFMLGALVGGAMRIAGLQQCTTECDHAERDLVGAARAFGEYLRGPKGTS